MEKINTSIHYPNFDYSSKELKKFLVSGDVISIQLKNGDIIHPTVQDPKLFKQWLLDNHIENIKL